MLNMEAIRLGEYQTQPEFVGVITLGCVGKLKQVDKKMPLK